MFETMKVITATAYIWGGKVSCSKAPSYAQKTVKLRVLVSGPQSGLR